VVVLGLKSNVRTFNMPSTALCNIVFYDVNTEEIIGFLAWSQPEEPNLTGKRIEGVICSSITDEIEQAIKTLRELDPTLKKCAWRSVRVDTNIIGS